MKSTCTVTEDLGISERVERLQSPETDLHSILRSPGGLRVQSSHRATPHGSDGSLNEPQNPMWTCANETVTFRLYPMRRNSTHFRDMSWQTDICTLYPHLSSASKQVGIENEHWYNTGRYTHFSVYFKTKRNSKQYCVEMWAMGFKTC